MADSTNIINTHENDVIFNIDSLREFIKLIKRQGTENIDFYAVSELLQPPGPNVMVTVPEGKKDGNLEPWIELYNDARRIQAEQNLLLLFDRIISSGGIRRKVYQYIPTSYERNYMTDDDGKIIGTLLGYHVYQASSFQEVTKASDIITKFVLRRNYVLSQEDENLYELEETLSDIPYTQEDFYTSFPASLTSTSYTKDNQYPMSYYENLNSLLSDFSNKNTIILNNKILYLNLPIAPTGDTPQLFFVIDPVEKSKIIELLSAYLSYNKQINIRKDENPVQTYIKRPIDNSENLPWWKFIYTKYNGNMMYGDRDGEPLYYTEFVEAELKANPGKIVVVRKIHPWQNNITENEGQFNINAESGRHLYIQAGSLLKFNPGKSTEDKNLIDDYWTDTTPGTFSIDENDAQKAHVITIRGFDQNGNFNNKNPIIGYTKSSDIPSTPSGNNGAYIINNKKYNLTPEQLAQLKQQPEGAYTIPVYLNHGEATITTHELIADTLTLAGTGSAGDKTKFLRNDSKWASELLGPLTLGDQSHAGINVRLGIWGNGNVDASGNDPATVSIHTKGGIKADKNIWGQKVFKAVFNDYAEFRTTINLSAGHVVINNDNGTLSCSTQRLQPGAEVISDTYGDAMGYSEKCQTPLAVAGRVLVYTYQPRENYHAGMAVCSAPNGTVDIMTREEIKEYPDCIIGIVSEIPNYEKWGTDQVDVNGRIWIKIK